MYHRLATSADHDAIRRVYWDAFADDERERVARLAVDLLSEQIAPAAVSFVVEVEESIVAHMAVSPVVISGHEQLRGFILSPLGVRKDHQARGVGSQLVEYGIQYLSELSADLLLVYGDPQYYRRFEFSAEVAEPFLPPYELQFPFGWQARLLSKRVSVNAPAPIACVSALSDPGLW